MTTRLSKTCWIPALALAVLAACGGEASTPDGDLPAGGGGEGAHGWNQGPLSEAFEAAALEFDLDAELLKSLGYVQSRFDMRDGEPTLDGGYGIMNLVQRDDRDMIAEAAEILDVDPEQLKTDPAANIRAGAALLRLYAEQQVDDPIELEEQGVEAFRDAVARYAGEVDPMVVEAFVDEVFTVYYEGAGLTVGDEVIEIPGAGVPEDVTAAMEQGLWGRTSQGVGEGGSIDRWVPASSSNYSRGRGGQSVRRIVIHTTQGSYAGAISWFQNPRASVSAHYVIRSSDGQITQMVRESDTAWHARDVNRYSVGIEHEGWVSNASWYTEAMYRASARLTCEIARRHGVPVDRTHVIGHAEAPGNDHTDPGRYWNWSHYMALVRECAPAGSGGGGSPGGGGGGGGTASGEAVLQGVIYQGANTSARIGGATVTVAGRSTTTNGNGYYTLRVPAGTQTITASKSGYQTKSIRRSVVRGADTWGSMGLVRNGGGGGSGGGGSAGGGGGGAVEQGNATLIGVVYERPDSDARIAGATVRLSTGATATTGADGVYRFRVTRGRTYRVTASKSGYTTNMVSRTVSASETWGSVGLARSVGTGVLRGVVFESPTLSRRLPGARVTLSNGMTAVSAADGSYSFRVPAGTYTVAANKSGYVPRALRRTVTGNLTTWGSLGLRRIGSVAPGGDGGGGAGQLGDAPEIVAPKDGVQVEADPEFHFRAPDLSRTERAVYTLVVASMSDALAEPQAFELEERAGELEIRRRVGANLAPDRYVWVIFATYPDSNRQSEMSDQAEFVVR